MAAGLVPGSPVGYVDPPGRPK